MTDGSVTCVQSLIFVLQSRQGERVIKAYELTGDTISVYTALCCITCVHRLMLYYMCTQTYICVTEQTGGSVTVKAYQLTGDAVSVDSTEDATVTLRGTCE